jgi:hypothetical protein
MGIIKKNEPAKRIGCNMCNTFEGMKRDERRKLRTSKSVATY